MEKLTRKEKEARDLAERLMDEISDWSFDRNHFADQIVHAHRSYQQNVFRLFIDCVERWAECKRRGFFDIRNAHTVTYSKRIVEELKGIEEVPIL